MTYLAADGGLYLPGDPSFPPGVSARDVSDRRENVEDTEFWSQFWDDAHRFEEENRRE